MADPVEEVGQEAEAPEVPRVEEEKPEKAKPKLQELPKEAPEEITLQTPEGPITFTKKKSLSGGAKKEVQPKSGKEQKNEGTAQESRGEGS